MRERDAFVRLQYVQSKGKVSLSIEYSVCARCGWMSIDNGVCRKCGFS